MTSNLDFPTNVISYYASTKGIDGLHSFNYWMRSKLVRIICNKAFARGDVLKLLSINTVNNTIIIQSEIVEEWEDGYPVLSFVSGRIIYNQWVDFEYQTTEGIQILKPIEQILSSNYSIGFITLVYNSGKISCMDKRTNNYFDVHISLDWEQ